MVLRVLAILAFWLKTHGNLRRLPELKGSLQTWDSLQHGQHGQRIAFQRTRWPLCPCRTGGVGEPSFRAGVPLSPGQVCPCVHRKRCRMCKDQAPRRGNGNVIGFQHEDLMRRTCVMNVMSEGSAPRKKVKSSSSSPKRKRHPLQRRVIEVLSSQQMQLFKVAGAKQESKAKLFLQKLSALEEAERWKAAANLLFPCLSEGRTVFPSSRGLFHAGLEVLFCLRKKSSIPFQITTQLLEIARESDPLQLPPWLSEGSLALTRISFC